SLPTPLSWANSVYHPQSRRIAVIGGQGSSTRLDSLFSFDPASGVIAAHTLRLPESRSQAGIAYSTATGKAYVFGGLVTFGPAVSSILEIDLGDGLTGGSIVTLTARLPQATYGASAAEDPISKLIYIVGGTGTNFDEAKTVKVFDPVTGQIWTSRLSLPGSLQDGGGAYDSINRNIVFAGGYNSNTVWRIPVGDGPQIKMARWDWLADQPAAKVNAIHGDGPKVAVGTNVGGAANGLYLYTEGGRSNPAIGLTAGQNVNDVRYSAANDQAWVASQTGLKIYGPGNTVLNYPGLTYTVKAVDLYPGYVITDGAPFVAPNLSGMWWRNFNTFLGNFWDHRYGSDDILDIRHRATGDVWASRADGRVYRLQYQYNPSIFGYDVITTNLGILCQFGDWPTGSAFDKQGDMWLVGTDDMPVLNGPTRPNAYTGVCRVRDPGGASTVNEFSSPLGDDASGVTVDRDGQIFVGWLSRNDGTGHGTGGLQVFQNLSGTVSTDAMTWLTAPIGSKISYAFAGQTNWASTVDKVGAVDEKLWYSSTLGLGTYAPRWQQINSATALEDCYVNKVFPVRGRLFAAAQCDPLNFFDRSLFVLQPDGKTFEKRNTYPAEARAVHGDARGRIWVGFNNGVRLYTPDGWTLFTDTVGTPPASVNAIAEDQDGRIWLGGNDGLTLYDRDRFVTTFSFSRLGLPGANINAMLVDSSGALWAGTDAGLAQVQRSGTVVTLTIPGGASFNVVKSLAQGSDGRLAVSTAGGLVFYNGTTFVVETVPGSAAGAPLAVDDLGRLWHGNSVRNSGGWLAYYNTNSGLIGSGVKDVATDGSGLVWFAHGNVKGISARGTQLPALGTVLPSVFSMIPASGSAGTVITITGTGFSANTSDNDVVVGGARADILTSSPTRL
ncbi:MAG: two-component regulator propeller domain-containing protein, partial [Thermoflexales bacterium]